MRCINRLPVLVLLFASPLCGTSARCQTQETQEKILAEQAVLALSANYLKQIGLAMHGYHDERKSLPAAAIYDKDGKALLSWRVAILPYLLDEEDRALYKEFKLDEPWDSDHNKKLLAKMPRVFASPTAKGKQNKTYYQVITGPNTVFAGNKGMKLAQIANGTSNTILAVEAGAAVPWTKPADVVYDAKKPLPKLGGVSKAGFHILLCDGSVRQLRPDFDAQTFRDSITPRARK